MLSNVEKVIFLQDIDVFQYIPSRELSRMAQVCSEHVLDAGVELYLEGDPADAMYIVIDGLVRLHKDGDEIMVAGEKDVFGVWSLFDDTQLVATATTVEACTLLKLRREDFIDLLADNIEVTESIFKALVSRVRGIMSG